MNYCYIVEYSFSYERIIRGPKASEEAMWEQMLAEATEEKRIDIEEMGKETILIVNKEEGKITLINPRKGEKCLKATWTLFQMEE